MSAVAKMHHTEISIGSRNVKTFLVPRQKAQGILRLIEEYRINGDDLLDANEAFKDINKKYTKPGALLQGYRLRDEMTQVELAKKLHTSQSAVAAMENGSRAISKTMATKLAEIFDTDYKNFL